MPMTIWNNGLVPASLGAAVLAFAAMPAEAESTDLDWLAIAYVWATDIRVDSRDRTIDVDFSDVVDKLEMAFLGHVEAQGDAVGGFVDVVFMGVGDRSSREAADVNADLDMTLMDLAAVWSPAAERYAGIEAFGGLRYISVDFDLVVDPLPPALPGAFGYLFVPALVIVSIASVAVAPLGARVAHALDVVRLKRRFALFLVAMAFYMLYRAVVS